MIPTPQFAPTRRCFLACLALGALAAPAARADSILLEPQLVRDIRNYDPTLRVSGYYSIRRFTQLSENDIYRINWAVKRGKTVRIQGYSVSESREIIRAAAQDWPTVRAELLRNQ